MRIAVVGAGPAGISAAYFLKHYDKENEHEVTLYERLPKEKWRQYQSICGEGVSEILFKEIEPIKPAYIIHKIKGIREYWPGGIEIYTKLLGYILDRIAFLESLIKEFEKKEGRYQVNNVVLDGENAAKVILSVGSKKEEFDYVIAAEGANSSIREKLGIEPPAMLPFIQYTIERECKDKENLEFHFDEKYEGNYRWVFPYKKTTKMGYPILKNKKIFKPKEGVIATQSRNTAFGGVKKIVKNRVLLIGDAAGQTNALTKGGIRCGMIAGKMAAEAISKKNPKLYEEGWKESRYADPTYVEAYKKLKEMDNKELINHITPLTNIKSIKNQIKVIIKIKTTHKRYDQLYQAYNKIEKWGW